MAHFVHTDYCYAVQNNRSPCCTGTLHACVWHASALLLPLLLMHGGDDSSPAMQQAQKPVTSSTLCKDPLNFQIA